MSNTVESLRPSRRPIAPATRPDIALLTPTGDRPMQFALCERWMARQTFVGAVQWIVVDDGRSPTAPTLGQEYVRREPRPDDPQHTLGPNLLEAISRVRAEKVLIIEDDDWYHPAYVERYNKALETADLVGGALAIYYNLTARRWKQITNMVHASLSETGFRACLLPAVAEACRLGPFVDSQLWGLTSPRSRLLFGERLSVGMKGFPSGRPGLTSGHILDGAYTPDPGLAHLRALIGDDAAAYEAILDPAGLPR